MLRPCNKIHSGSRQCQNAPELTSSHGHNVTHLLPRTQCAYSYSETTPSERSPETGCPTHQANKKITTSKRSGVGEMQACHASLSGRGDTRGDSRLPASSQGAKGETQHRAPHLLRLPTEGWASRAPSSEPSGAPRDPRGYSKQTG